MTLLREYACYEGYYGGFDPVVVPLVVPLLVLFLTVCVKDGRLGGGRGGMLRRVFNVDVPAVVDSSCQFDQR